MLLSLATFACPCDWGLVMRVVGDFQLFLSLFAIERFTEGLRV